MTMMTVLSRTTDTHRTYWAYDTVISALRALTYFIHHQPGRLVLNQANVAEKETEGHGLMSPSQQMAELRADS